MNKSKVEGVFDEAKGKVKQAVGETFNNQKLANSGAADQVKGQAKETWGNVKDAAGNVGNKDVTSAKTSAEHTGESLRDKITSGAKNVKDSVSRGLDRAENKVR